MFPCCICLKVGKSKVERSGLGSVATLRRAVLRSCCPAVPDRLPKSSGQARVRGLLSVGDSCLLILVPGRLLKGELFDQDIYIQMDL